MTIRSVSIIVPVYNEKLTIGMVLSELRSLDLGGVKKEVIIVNDGSTDGTKEIIDRNSGGFIVLHLKENRGKGAAIAEAIKEVTGEYVVVHDADLELDPSDIKKLIDVTEKTGNIAFGSRALRGEKPRGWNLFYLWGGWGITAIVNFLFGTKLTDVSCSYKLVPSDLLESLHCVEEGFAHEVELTGKIASRGFVISEVPVFYMPRSVKNGKKLKMRDGFSIVFCALKIFWQGRREGTIRLLFDRYSDELFLSVLTLSACFASFVLISYTDPDRLYAPETAFFNLAKNMVEHGVYADNDAGALALYPHSAYPPLYPVLIMPFVGLPVLAIILNWIFRVLVVVLTYRLARKLLVGRKIAYGAAFLFALEPYHLIITNMATPEMVFTALLLFYVIVVWKYAFRRTTTTIFFGSLFLGLAALTRPVSQFLLPIQLIFIFFSNGRQFKKAVWHSVLSVAIFALTLFPWLYRNYRLYGEWSLSSLPSIQILNAAMPHFYAWKDGGSGAQEEAIFEYMFELKKEASKLIGYDITNRFTLDVEESAVVMENIAKPFIYQNGIQLAIFYVTQLPFQLATDNWRTALEHMTNWSQSTKTTLADAISAVSGNPGNLLNSIKSADAYLVAFLSGKIYWGLAYILGFVGFVALFEKSKTRLVAAFFAFFVFYFPFLSLPYLEARYRLPGTPFLFALAAFGMAYLLARAVKPQRSGFQKIKDAVTFPIRALTLFENDRFGLSSLASERFDYVSLNLRGRCLDIGCGRKNRFINEYAKNNGVGIDVFKYEGLTGANIVEDMTKLPFQDESFDSVTFIADLNHVPKSKRDAELKEAFRCLRKGGNIIVTMGNPLAELIVHKVVYWYDRLLGTKVDMDTERGMDKEEEYYLSNREIKARLRLVGFKNIEITYFATQWGLNHLFVGEKV